MIAAADSRGVGVRVSGTTADADGKSPAIQAISPKRSDQAFRGDGLTLARTIA